MRDRLRGCYKSNTALSHLNDMTIAGETVMAQPTRRHSESNIGQVILFCVGAAVFLGFVLVYIR